MTPISDRRLAKPNARVTMWIKIDPLIKQDIQRWAKQKVRGDPKVIAGSVINRHWADWRTRYEQSHQDEIRQVEQVYGKGTK